MGVNITTIVYQRVLIIEIGSSIIFIGGGSPGGRFSWLSCHVFFLCQKTGPKVAWKIHENLPRGAEWMIRGAYNTPSLRVQTAPFGRCWYVLV